MNSLLKIINIPLPTVLYLNNNSYLFKLRTVHSKTFKFQTISPSTLRYTHDLDSFRTISARHSLPDQLRTIVTPLNHSAWALQLQHMPDKPLVHYLLSGMQFGFRIGCNRQSTKLKSAGSNMRSASTNPQPANDFIPAERQAGTKSRPRQYSTNPHQPFRRYTEVLSATQMVPHLGFVILRSSQCPRWH